MYFETYLGLAIYLVIGFVVALIVNEGMLDHKDAITYALFWPLFLLIVVLNHFVDLLIKLLKGE